MTRIGIDAGHGMSSRTPGVFDPGATNQVFREADIVLLYAHALEDEAQRRGWPTFMTRRDNVMPSPLNKRVLSALVAECSVLISIHCNASPITAANGVETLYLHDKDLADRIQVRVSDVMGLRDRGTKERDDLAILRFPSSALVELGFLSNPWDLAMLLKPEKPVQVAAAICNAISHSEDL